MTQRVNGRVALLIVAAGILVVVLAGWFAFVSPERSKAAKLDTQIADTRLQIDDVNRLLRSSARRTSAARLRQLEIAVPDQAQVSALLRQLSSAADRAHVELDGVTPAGANGQQLPITLSVTGRYFAIRDFLHILRTRTAVHGERLRASGRLFTVDSVGFTGGGGKGVVTATLNLNAYVFGLGAALPTTSTTSAESSTTAASP